MYYIFEKKQNFPKPLNKSPNCFGVGRLITNAKERKRLMEYRLYSPVNGVSVVSINPDRRRPEQNLISMDKIQSITRISRKTLIFPIFQGCCSMGPFVTDKG